jgi:uncharacterized protein DUF6077/6-pyruvoyl-tetrahydropterin synthase-like protein
MNEPRGSTATALLLISACALCVVLPFLYFGIPSGHDFEFHFNSWIEVIEHWKNGNLYPHWAAMAHFGYGEARFIFYPPLSWTLGALLGLALPSKLLPSAYICIVLTLAGWSMFALASNWLSRRDAIFAAVLYAASPYNLVIVYWRSALAELMAAIYLPLLLLLLLRLAEDDDGRRAVLPLSLVMAAGWLTNVPSAVMMNYSLAVLVLTLAVRGKKFSVLLLGALSVFLGALLAGFYLLPVFHQQSWVNIAEVLGPGVRPQDNFLFTNTEDVDHNRFNLLISMVAVTQIVIVAGAMSRWRRARPKLWPVLLIWAVCAAALMLMPTSFLWNSLPELRFVQFPWRWLLCLNVPFALAVAFGFRRWRWRGLICAVALMVLVVVWHRVQVPWWDNAGDIQEMLDNQQGGTGNEGVDEYVPAGTDAYDIDKNAPLVLFAGTGSAQINIQQWSPEKRLLVANVSAPGDLILRLFNYPSWKVKVNGRAVKSNTMPHTGQLVVPVAAGENRVQIDFVEGWDRKVGFMFSIFTIILLIIWRFAGRRRARLSPVG